MIDPTLAAPPSQPILPQLSPMETALINKVQSEGDSQALAVLIDTHSGIYKTVAERYYRYLSPWDVEADRMTNIYHWIVAYKPEKSNGKTLGQYIGDRTKWWCLHAMKRDEHNPLSNMVTSSLPAGDSTFMYSYAPQEGANTGRALQGDATTANGEAVFLIDATPGSRPDEVANLNLGMQEVISILDNDTIPTMTDQFKTRFRTIIQRRYIDSPGATLRKLGKELGISHEMVNKIYRAGIERLRGHLSVQEALSLATA